MERTYIDIPRPRFEDFSDLPSWAAYLTQDLDGTWYAWEHKPHYRVGPNDWYADEGMRAPLFDKSDACTWILRKPTEAVHINTRSGIPQPDLTLQLSDPKDSS